MLRTNLTLFESLFALGAQPKNVYAIGKGYSTSPDCVEKLRETGMIVVDDLQPPVPGFYEEARERELQLFWNTVHGCRLLEDREPVIVVDVGGRLLSLIQSHACASEKWCVTGVEQTTSGVRRLERRTPSFPVVNVAQSAAKSIQESPLIAQTILDRLDQLRPHLYRRSRVGVIGLGGIGRAMMNELASRGADVVCADLNNGQEFKGYTRQLPIDDLVRQSAVIFGCTGSDVFPQGLPADYQPDLVLVSCSSEDVEFKTLLRSIAYTETQPILNSGWPACDLAYMGVRGKVTILCGGYPLNFDTSGVSVPDLAIQATTALMLAGVLTAATILNAGESKSAGQFVQLPTSLQSAILQRWSSDLNESAMRTELNSSTDDFLASHSAGRAMSNQQLLERIASSMMAIS